MKELKHYQTAYRGCIIEPHDMAGYRHVSAYQWHHPDKVDCDWDGDGWNFVWCGQANTIEDCKQQIDEYYEEIPGQL